MSRDDIKHKVIKHRAFVKRLAIRAGVSATIAGTIVGMSACVNRPVEVPSKFDVLEPGGYFPQTKEKKVDMLFVIDDSISMLDDQLELKQRISELVEALRVDDDQIPAIDPATCTETNRAGCNIPSIRVGVTTTNLGAGAFIVDEAGTRQFPCDSPEALPAFINPTGIGGNLGKLRNFSTLSSFPAPAIDNSTSPPVDSNVDCGLGGKDFIDYDSEATPPVANVPAANGDPVEDVISAIQCLSTVGGQGCFFEQPLEAAKRALDPALGLNPGFLRDDALLSVIIITDEDDCSTPRPDLNGTATAGPEIFATEVVTIRKIPENGIPVANDPDNPDGKQDFVGPSRTGKYDPATGTLGLYGSFRCFEQGVKCEDWEGPIDARNHVGPIDETTCAAAPEGYGLLTSVSSYVDFFRSLKPDPSRVLVTVFAGPTTIEDGYVGISGNTPVTEIEDVAFSDILDIGEIANQNAGTPYPFDRSIVSVFTPPSPYLNLVEQLAISSYPPAAVADHYVPNAALMPSCTRPNSNYDSSKVPSNNPTNLNQRFLQSGDPAIRLKTLTDSFGNNGQFASICSPSFGPALKELGELINSKLGAQCIDSPILTEKGNVVCASGLANSLVDPAATCTNSCLEQAECVVQDVTNISQGTGTIVPKCDETTFLDENVTDCTGATNCPCWRLRAKPECDPAKTGSPFGLDILRDTSQPIQQGLITTSRCSGTTAAWGSAELLSQQECD